MDTAQHEISPADYARECRLTLSYVYSQLWAGRLPARRVRGRWLIFVSAVADRNARNRRIRDIQKGDEVRDAVLKNFRVGDRPVEGR